MDIVYPETPKGKRSIRVNIWGNVVGYVAGRRFWEFGTNNSVNEKIAGFWLGGASLEDANVNCWL